MKIGIIGGSGLYALDGVDGLREEIVDTPFGDPSGALTCGRLAGREVVFLARHGNGHRLLPSEIPFRANIWALKHKGVTHLLSVSAVGSLREEIAPGHIVFPDQFIDRTHLRLSTFFGRGLVAHVQFGDPVCPELLDVLEASGKAAEATCHKRGTYICMEGPAFSTRAESNLYRTWGGSVIGMTNLQEAKLAREAEICFATIALSTDYDCWHEHEAEVSVEAVIQVMQENVATSKRILIEAVRRISEVRHCGCNHALRDAILTRLDQAPESTKRELEPLLKPYLPRA